MYIKEFENVEVILTHYSQPSKWKKSVGYKPEIDKPFNVHWSLLKSKKDYRIKFIKVKCDDCGIIHERRIRDLDPNNNYHLCKNCKTKGERNGNFGKPYNEKCREGLIKWIEKNGNPFTWESSKQKIKEKQGWLIMAKKRIGFKHSEKTRKKMSISAVVAFKEGRRNPSSGWGKIKIRQYKGIDYQSSYELKFLKYLESINKLDIIERGPSINYFDKENKEHIYYIDYRIKNTSIVFEIKSDYLWNKNKEINELKKDESQKIFDYHLIINNNFKTIEKIFENYD
jgi:hypothetical protein